MDSNRLNKIKKIFWIAVCLFFFLIPISYELKTIYENLSYKPLQMNDCNSCDS